MDIEENNVNNIILKDDSYLFSEWIKQVNEWMNWVKVMNIFQKIIVVK